MSSNAWRASHNPSNTSQFSLDLFEIWKRQQSDALSERGASKDEHEEEEHNRVMLRHNLNAYMCYKEVDQYTSCLKKHSLLTEENEKFEINTRNKLNEKYCRSTHNAYASCMSSQRNQETVMDSAAMHPHCASRRSALLQCFERSKDKELSSLGAPDASAPDGASGGEFGEGLCRPLYRSLLRCGLNHMWNDYWRSLMKFSDADEYHLYELSRDDNKKQEYLRMISLSEDQQRQYLHQQQEQERGYHITKEPSEPSDSR